MEMPSPFGLIWILAGGTEPSYGGYLTSPSQNRRLISGDDGAESHLWDAGMAVGFPFR